MKRYTLAIIMPLAVSLGIVCTVSCGDKSDGLKPEINQQVGDMRTSAKTAGGDYSKLSDADKQKVLQMAHGSETQAKALVSQMAMDPRQMNAGKGGAPPSQ